MIEQESRVARSEFATRLFVVLVFAIALVSLSVLTVLAIQDHHRIKQNDEIQQFIKDQAVENGQISESIRDCTSPGGECYQRSQDATADAVGDINRVIVLAAACAVGVDPQLSVQLRQSAIQTCVINRLAAKP